MTKPDLSRQSIIPSGNTASFDGSISIGEKLLVNNIEFAVSGITSGQTLVYNSSLNKLLPTSIDLNASSTLSGMTDVNFTTLVSGDTIVWNSATNKWENNNIVLNTDSIINTSTVTGSTTTNALDNLNTNKADLTDLYKLTNDFEAVTTSITLEASKMYVVFPLTTDILLTLPAHGINDTNTVIVIHKVDSANIVTVAGYGVTTYLTDADDSVIYMSNGSVWIPFSWRNNASANAYSDSLITQTITNGVTDKSPSEDAVYDVLVNKADLVAGKVPTSQLPSYVDDVIEGYYYTSIFYEDSGHTITITGETSKIYIDLPTNLTYRWSGSVYIEISSTTLLGTTNRITVSGSTIDIASTYTGQTSIDTVGGITTGSWSGTPINDAYISSASTWNAKQNQLNGNGFVRTTGTTIDYLSGTTNQFVKADGSLDSNVYLTGVTPYIGTTNRITVTGSTIDIASTYTGQTSIDTVGGITTGSWSGTSINDAYISSASNWNVAYNNRISTFTVTGNSGSSTFTGNVLNIPTYTLSGLGGQPQLNGNGFVRATGTTIGYLSGTTNQFVKADGSLDSTSYGETVIEIWSTDAPYATLNKTAKRLVVIQTGLLSAPRLLNLGSASSTGQEVIVLAGQYITATNYIVVGVGWKINVNFNSIDITVPFSQTLLTSTDNGGGWSTGQLYGINGVNIAAGISERRAIAIATGSQNKFVGVVDGVSGWSQENGGGTFFLQNYDGTDVGNGSYAKGTNNTYYGGQHFFAIGNASSYVEGYYYNGGTISSLVITKPSSSANLTVALVGGKIQVVSVGLTFIRQHLLQTWSAGAELPGLNQKYSSTGLASYWTGSGGLGIGHTSQNASAILQADSTTKGFLPPRMTNAQMIAIASPATGLLVYQTDGTSGLYQYNGTAWVGFGSSNDIAVESWTTDANYTTVNTTAKRLIILHSGPLSTSRSLILTSPSVSQEVIVVAGATVSATNKIVVVPAYKINGNSFNSIDIVLPHSQTWLTYVGNAAGGFPAGTWSTSQASPQFTETSTALTASKYVGTLSGFNLPNTNSFTAPFPTGFVEGSMTYNRGTSALLVRNSVGQTAVFLPYILETGWKGYYVAGNVLKYWDFTNNIASTLKPIEWGDNQVWNRQYTLEHYPSDGVDNQPFRCIFQVNSTGVPSILQVLQSDGVTQYTISGGQLVLSGSRGYTTVKLRNHSLTNRLPELYEKYSADGQTRFLTGTGGLGIGHSSQNASAILQADSTVKGSLPAPRMTAAQRVAIASPVAGLLVYQTDVHAGYWYHDGTIWQDLSQPRVGTTASSATPTINTDVTDYYEITGQTVDITSFTTNLTGTPVRGQKLWIDITGTAARAITWGASFEASTIALPTTTVNTSKLSVGFIWNVATSKWRCIGTC